MFWTLKLFLLVRFVCAFPQDISFPESASQRLDAQEESRVPLYAPQRCPENQYLWPGDQPSDWICDCAPGYIYYPPKDGCFAPYRKGPCSAGEHLILMKNKVVPECVPNPCEEGYAKHKSKPGCFKLDAPNGPCEKITAGGGIFGVNATTLEVECLKGTDVLSLFDVPKTCPPGSKRDNAKRCRDIF